MSSTLTIVTYHYVRDVEKSRFPGIKAIGVQAFDAQLAYFDRRFQYVTLDECLAALRGDTSLPNNAILLSFDDGYREHCEVVKPLLEEHGATGCFFPSVRSAAQRRMLDVNKIQFLVAGMEAPALLAEIFLQVDLARTRFALKSNAEYYARLASRGRFDTAEVMCAKRLLQRELPEELRHEITRALFAKHISADEESFAEDLYMTMQDLRVLNEAGMRVGGHGDRHCWLDHLEESELRFELALSAEFVRRVGTPAASMTICYPYGAYNETVIAEAKAVGFRAGFTVRSGTAELCTENAFELPRRDTNEFPQRY